MQTIKMSCYLAVISLISVVATTHYRRVETVGLATAKASSISSSLLDNEGEGVGPIRNLRFTLFDSGIRPTELRVKAGLLNILIEDRTKASQGIAVQRVVDGDRRPVGAVQKTVDEFRGRNAFRLVPGEYELFDQSLPANKARLLVEP